MARDTDRKVISEHLRLHPGSWSQQWGNPNQLALFNDATRELVLTYSSTGRLTHVTHWDPVAASASSDQVYASRRPIERNKRQRVLDIILTKGHS